MKKPLIAMTARNQSEKPDNKTLSNNRSYADYIEVGGGLPLIVFVRNEDEADQIAETCDGLLITGGEDCNPANYSEENTDSFPIEEDLEQSDFLLYRAFKKAGKPILGICRGIQVIAVCEGAHLIQDIPSLYKTEHNQAKLTPAIVKDEPCHSVFVKKESRLYDIFGEKHPVNSFHHQAVKELPNGFTLSCKSEEGIIEGIEKDHITAVQWHPERLIHDPKQTELIQKWIASCKLFR